MANGEDWSKERSLRLALLGEVAGEAAHELRNALAVIGASAELCRGVDAERTEHHIAKIQRNARIAQDVVDTLMALARGEQVRAESVPLAAAISEARRDLEGAVEYADDYDPRITVRASAVLLSRLFRILYENAMQAAAPRAAKITTRARIDDAGLTVEISDDGPGIPPEIRDTLFEPLVSGKPGGTGLGLALARRAARAHGGDLDLATSDRGACFRLRLPQ